MKDETREKLLDDYTLSELRRATEAGRLRAETAVAELVEKLAKGERIDDLAKLAYVIGSLVARGRS